MDLFASFTLKPSHMSVWTGYPILSRFREMFSAAALVGNAIEGNLDI